MAEEKNTSTISTETPKKTAARQLNGTSFLTLEHIGFFALVVLLPSLLLVGASTALQLWQSGSAAGGSGSTFLPLSYTVEPIMRYVDSTVAIGLCAAFLVLVPLMYVLRRRTAAEYAKRPGYTSRVAYKLPVYTALAVLAAQTVGAFASMLGVFLNSLVNIGVKGADIGAMYTSQFVPALLAFAVFGLAAWYVMWFAKGRDLSKLFVGGVGLLATVLTIALFVTTLTLNHDSKSNNIDPIMPQPYPQPYDLPTYDY
ncbi:MAG TPA: hypothetical protein VJM46_01505 [Candidatus Saccharimonadales bacterium]|nr:hypothetical protein [Candidatus Saccharimonadales bacterium]